ncbi:MAG TPA: hypothetical protein VGC91_14935 [Pyrinomonadaceae bacterium]|jgi:hypothetical protein
MPDPAKPVMHTVAFGANDIDSLKTLEISCETQEAHLLANIQSVQRAKDDGILVTAVVFKEVSGFKMGHLTFVEYNGTDVDEQSQRAIHTSQGETFICKGEAFVKNNPVKVLVFREKPKS